MFQYETTICTLHPFILSYIHMYVHASSGSKQGDGTEELLRTGEEDGDNNMLSSAAPLSPASTRLLPASSAPSPWDPALNM